MQRNSSYMPFSDHLVRDAIRRLSPTNARITYRQIAEAIECGCSVKTVERAVIRLERAGLLKRNGHGRHVGYQYELNQEAG